jgi:hypothetical protein
MRIELTAHTRSANVVLAEHAICAGQAAFAFVEESAETSRRWMGSWASWSGLVNGSGSVATLAAITHNLTRATGCAASAFHAKDETATIREQPIQVPTRIARSPRCPDPLIRTRTRP